MRNRNTICHLVIIASISVSLFSSGFVLAATQSDEKQYRTSPNGEGALTPKMIRNCISMKKDLDQQADEAAAMKQKLEEMGEELKQTEEQLLGEEKLLDPADRNAVTEHNGKVAVLKERLAEYQEKTQKYNAQIQPFTKLEKKYKRLCDDQLYYEDDYEQAKSEMGYSLE